MIHVTKTFLPPIAKYSRYLEQVWKNGWVTNNGMLVLELEEKLQKRFSTRNLFFVSNGTAALQIAIQALGLKGEIITTPFSYVATTGSILWQGLTPVFCDIDPLTLTIDADMITPLINRKTSAIIATHIYGNPCDIETIGYIAKKHKLSIIYDAAHCFGVCYKGRSLYAYGDISTASFHATKIFHTVEGGAVVNNTGFKAISKQIDLYRAFGHAGDEHFCIGTNAKNSELHAAMGLCNLKYIDQIIQHRESLHHTYDEILQHLPLKKPVIRKNTEYNYAYYPVIFPTEKKLLEAKRHLEKYGICPRRYFYPSLNTLQYVKYYFCPVSESISKRVLCLPLYYDLTGEDQQRICRIINTCF